MMTTVARRRLAIALGSMALAVAISWLVGHDTSPLHGYFLWHQAVPNIWTTMNLPAIYLGVAVSGNLHQPSTGGCLLGLAGQWGALGAIASLILVRNPPAQGRHA